MTIFILLAVARGTVCWELLPNLTVDRTDCVPDDAPTVACTWRTIFWTLDQSYYEEFALLSFGEPSGCQVQNRQGSPDKYMH